MFIELHMIQNFAPANLNRDDTGNPKDCEFGGHRRARISSQCIKRAIRLNPIFAQTTGVEIGERTKWMTRLLVKSLEAAGKQPDEIHPVANAFAKSYAGKVDSKTPEKTSVLLYLSPNEISTISKVLLDNWESAIAEEAGETSAGKTIADLVKEIVKATKNRTSAPDIALFGRMLADKPELNLDAACQVAHAISTHRVNMEMDFYTAVDDLLQEEEAGAGMVGFTSFNSACFYRYARLDWNQLLANLDRDVGLSRRTVQGFLRASIAAVPTGKQNAFAAQNPPSFLVAAVRDDGLSWSLANAFETPVRPGRDTGYIRPSIAAFDTYWGKLERVYGRDGMKISALQIDDDQPLDYLASASQPDQEAWIGAVLSALPEG